MFRRRLGVLLVAICSTVSVGAFTSPALADLHCPGSFFNITANQDENGTPYVHWGGQTVCVGDDPAPTQSLTVSLQAYIGGRWVAQGSAFWPRQVGYTATASGERNCANTDRVTYRQVSRATVNGVTVQATDSDRFTIPCTLTQFRTA